MKKVFLLLLSIIPVITASACNGSITVEPESYINARILIDKSYTEGAFGIEAELVSSPEGLVHITVSSPDELCGLSFKWCNGLEISCHGLSAEAPSTYLPQGAFALIIRDVLTDIRGESVEIGASDEYAVLNGVTSTGYTYTVITDHGGCIKRMCVKEYGLDVRFLY